MKGFLSENCKLTKVSDVAAAGTSEVNGAVIDMAGWDGVIFLAAYGTAAANNAMYAQEGDASNLSDAADLADSQVSAGASDEDQYVDVQRPGKRYIRAVAARGTSSTVENIWAIQYRARGHSAPADNTTAGTINGVALVSPAAGTK